MIKNFLKRFGYFKTDGEIYADFLKEHFSKKVSTNPEMRHMIKKYLFKKESSSKSGFRNFFRLFDEKKNNKQRHSCAR